MPGVIATLPKFQFSANGAPMVGGTLETYVAGTTTPATTWQDSALSIANTNPVTLDARGECVLWLDSAVVYKFVLKNALGVIQWTQDNISGASPGDILGRLAASSGSSLVVYEPAGIGAATRTVQTKMRDWMSAADFAGVDPTGATDSTAGLAAFITAAKLKGYGMDLSGVFKVTQLTLTGMNGMHIRGDCTLLGATTGSYPYVLGLKNTTDFTYSGRMIVSGSYNAGYASAIKLWSDTGGGCSQISLQGVSAVNAIVGWQFGEQGYPDALISEIAILGGYTAATPIAVFAVGTQTVVNFVGYQLQSSSGAGTGAFLSTPQETVVVRGGNVIQTGGELLHTSNTTGCSVKLQPITSGVGLGNSYGSFKATGTLIETCALLQTDNTGAVATPTGGAGSFVQCNGYTSQNTAFVGADANFTGDLVFLGNDFYAGSARTAVNIDCGGAAHVWCDEKSFGRNFLPPLKGITGGIAHFSQRMVLAASDLASQALPNSAQTTLKYSVVDTSGDMVRFSSGYSAATGIYTVPTGGLKNVQIFAGMYLAGMTSAEVYLQINNVIRAAVQCNKGFSVSYAVPALVAGDQIKIVLYNVASGALTGTGGALDFLQIFAAN